MNYSMHLSMHISFCVFHALPLQPEKQYFKSSAEQCGRAIKHLNQNEAWSRLWAMRKRRISEKPPLWMLTLLTTFLDTSTWTSHASPEYQFPGTFARVELGQLNAIYSFSHPSLLLHIWDQLNLTAFLILAQEIKRDIHCCMTQPASARQVTNLQQLKAHLNLTLHRLCSYF